MTEFPQVAEIIELLHTISNRTDTAYVLVTATALEEVLEMGLLSEMRDLSNAAYSDLFKGYGPLSSFSAKIDIAYALKIISDDLVGDFRAIKAIRNAFAHPRELVHFKSPELPRLSDDPKIGW